MALRQRRPIGVTDWGDDIAIPMKPVFGMWSFVAGQDVPIGGSPDMLNCVVSAGFLRKRPGYQEFIPGMSDLGGQIMGLYSTQDVDNNTYLYALTVSGVNVVAPGSGSWASVSGPALTGTTSRMFQFETSQNSVVFSQGVDNIMKIVFGGSYAALSADSKPARYLTRFADRLFEAYTFESSANCPFRVRRSVAEDHTDWTGIGSGFHDLTEFPYHIRGIKKMGPSCALYTEKAIYMGTRTELVDAPVRWDVEVTEIGLYAPHTLVGRNDQHRFLGLDDLYIFNGQQVQSFGYQIRDSLFPVLNINKLDAMFAEMTFDTQEYLLFACIGSDDTPSTVWVNNWARDIWYPWSVNGPTCSAIHRLDAGVTIDDLDVPIDSQLYEIDSQASQGAYPALLTGHTDGKVYRWTKAALSDNGTAIPVRWASKDFTAEDIGAPPDQKIVLKAVHVRYKETGASSTLTFFSSVDGGSSWSSMGSMALAAGTNAVRLASVSKQVTGNQIRFKFENNTADESFMIQEIIPVFEKPDSKVLPA